MTWARCRTKQKLDRVISWNSKTPLWLELLWEHLVQPLFSLHHGDLSQVSGVCKSGHNIAIKHLSFPSHSRSAPTHTHTRASTSCVSQILVKNTQMWAAYRRYNQNTEAHCAATTLHPCFFGWHTHSLPIMLLCTSSFPCTSHWGRPSLSTCRRWSVMRRSYPMRSYFLCPKWSFLSCSCSFRWAPVTEKARDMKAYLQCLSLQSAASYPPEEQRMISRQRASHYSVSCC